jgi:hypothetical protein
MNTDLLDEFCMKTYGHTNWFQVEGINEQIGEDDGDYIAIVFLKEDCYE